jgi:hypothetical protein
VTADAAARPDGGVPAAESLPLSFAVAHQAFNDWHADQSGDRDGVRKGLIGVTIRTLSSPNSTDEPIP